MDFQHFRLRVALESFYAVTVLVILCFIARGNYFCNRPGSSGFFIPALSLTVGVSVWDLISGILGAMTARSGWRWVAPVLVSVAVFAGLARLPSIVFRGNGAVAFSDTRADVSCFVTEGYGMMFPFTVAPLFAVLSLVRELLFLRLQRRQGSAN
jgi:hypothetical protein